jgi:hypothetical protein
MRTTNFHPHAVMCEIEARSQNLPGNFTGFRASSRHSEIDPEVDGSTHLATMRLLGIEKNLEEA